jgi:hypothetical protein
MPGPACADRVGWRSPGRSRPRSHGLRLRKCLRRRRKRRYRRGSLGRLEGWCATCQRTLNIEHPHADSPPCDRRGSKYGEARDTHAQAGTNPRGPRGLFTVEPIANLLVRGWQRSPGLAPRLHLSGRPWLCHLTPQSDSSVCGDDVRQRESRSLRRVRIDERKLRA